MQRKIIVALLIATKTEVISICRNFSVLILRDLMDGTKRFGQLMKSIGNVSQKVLTSQLRDREKRTGRQKGI